MQGSAFEDSVMSQTLTLRCACGAVEGEVIDPPWLNRAICYCDSCQGFPQRLGKAAEVLDEQGGTDIVQTAPKALRITRGEEHLACLRMTSKGPLRWFADCCNTPIGNTGGTPKLAFIGLLHNCLGGHEALDAACGPPRAIVHVDGARGEPKPVKQLPPTVVLGLVGRLLMARLDGSWKRNPLFDDQGHPVASPSPPES